MSNPDSKPPSIPQWQQRNSAPSPNSEEQDSPARAALVEQASKFLQDDSIKDAPTDRKIEFLESKGLSSAEIESLLGVSRNPEATTTTAEENKTTETSSDASSSSISSTTETQSSSSSPSAPTIAAPAANAGNKTMTSRPRDVPPIITYPEFLFQESKPPPLVSLQTVLYTLYGAAGLGASIYAASEYLVKPMLSNLTSARHDLATTTEGNLKKLNEKLEQNVSRIPPYINTKKSSDESKETAIDSPDSEETDSITSDPTELFHRDVATQTSPQEDQQKLWSSADTNPLTDETIVPDPTAMVTTHQKRLESIGSHLREFADAQNQSGTLEDTTRSRLSDLQHYLDGLIYSKNTYGAAAAYGVYTTPGLDSSSGASSGVGKGEEEAIASFRSEIRGVKGALLSARNFPASRGARINGSSLSR